MLASSRLVVYLILTFALVPVQLLALALGWGLAQTLPVFYHRCVCRLFGFRVAVEGRPATGGPVLFIANHGSYIDIEILGSVIRGSFIAKSDVAQWPLFGMLARLQRTVFIDRFARTASKTQRDTIATRLQAGDSLILFPEGTSNDGTRLVPFKSSLFGAAEIQIDGRPVTVQPVTIAYTKVDGMPMLRRQRPDFAWYGDMGLAGHLWHLIGREGVTFTVVFHEPVSLSQFASRKTLAVHCERLIAQTLAAANAGRPPYPQVWNPVVEPEAAGLKGSLA